MSIKTEDVEKLAARIEANKCPVNSGCGTQPVCACCDADDSAVTLRALSSERDTLRAENEHLSTAVADHHVSFGNLRAAYQDLQTAGAEALEFLGYLINHLPEDARDNRVWLKLRAALGEK